MDNLGALISPSPLSDLRASTIELAQRLNLVIASIEDKLANAEVQISLRRGIPKRLLVTQEHSIDGFSDLLERLADFAVAQEQTRGYSTINVETKQGEATLLRITHSFKLD